jgi:hypothetical protein
MWGLRVVRPVLRQPNSANATMSVSSRASVWRPRAPGATDSAAYRSASRAGGTLTWIATYKSAAAAVAEQDVHPVLSAEGQTLIRHLITHLNYSHSHIQRLTHIPRTIAAPNYDIRTCAFASCHSSNYFPLINVPCASISSHLSYHYSVSVVSRRRTSFSFSSGLSSSSFEFPVYTRYKFTKVVEC